MTKTASKIRFKAKLFRPAEGKKREPWTFLTLPKDASAKLPPTGYELLEPIGRGGMGVVFKARQRALGRMVALKQIRAGLDADAQELARFHAETLAAARLAHPNIVKVFDVGQQDGLPFIAMELVEGGRLPDRLANGPLPPHEAAVLVESLARAVEHAHQQGIVHRDLKPANILLAPDLTPRIVDFGLVKFQDRPSETKSGALLGTPRYMAPEQAAGDVATPAVDIHALGAILYECLTGRPPFQAATALEVIEQIRNKEPVVPGRLQPGVQRDLQTICMKCLEKDPRRRYATAGAGGRSGSLFAFGTDLGAAGRSGRTARQVDLAQAVPGGPRGRRRARPDRGDLWPGGASKPPPR